MGEVYCADRRTQAQGRCLDGDGVRPRLRYTGSVGQSVVERAPGVVRSGMCGVGVSLRTPNTALVCNPTTPTHRRHLNPKSSAGVVWCTDQPGRLPTDRLVRRRQLERQARHRRALRPTTLEHGFRFHHQGASSSTGNGSPTILPSPAANDLQRSLSGGMFSGNKGTESAMGAGLAGWVCRNG